jgi:deoxyribonuclease-4
MPLGAHMSIAGGVSRGLERADQIEIDAVQIFTKNNNRWFESPLKPEEVERFRRRASRFGRDNLISHAAYLINLAAPDEEVHKRSLDALYDELIRAEALGLSWVVLNHILERTKGFRVGVLLETTAGQGSNLGYTFKQLALMRKKVAQPKRVGICVDTCHIFAAGYDLRDLKSYRASLAELDRTIGLKHVHAIHLNDSQKPLGSRVDRHAHIGEGEIGLAGFSFVMNDARLAHLPMVLETPKGPDMKEDVENLSRLRDLIGKVEV